MGEWLVKDTSGEITRGHVQDALETDGKELVPLKTETALSIINNSTFQKGIQPAV